MTQIVDNENHFGG